MDTGETEVCGDGNTRLFLRTSRQKTPVESVTLAQWISANAKIMAHMIKDNKLATQESLLDYLQYVQDFGDYAQVCEHSSLMIYDQEFRRKQIVKDSSWASEDVHLATFYLQRRYNSNRNGGQAARNLRQERPPRMTDNEGKEICRNFNSYLCTKDNCRYSHVCSLCKKSDHSRLNHK